MLSATLYQCLSGIPVSPSVRSKVTRERLFRPLVPINCVLLLVWNVLCGPVTFVSQVSPGGAHNTRLAQGAPAPRGGVGGEGRAVAALRLFPPPTTRSTAALHVARLLSPAHPFSLPGPRFLCRAPFIPAPSVRTTRCLASPRPAVHHADFREDPHR